MLTPATTSRLALRTGAATHSCSDSDSSSSTAKPASRTCSSSSFSVRFAVIVFGPFMSSAARESLKERAAKFPNIRTLTFTNNLGALMKQAAGVVAMGGYNTFCEILSFDKPALIVPRTTPRLEQFIRASRAQELGLASMLVDDFDGAPAPMATALRKLPWLKRPSSVLIPGLLAGHETIAKRADHWLSHMVAGPLSAEPAASERMLGLRAQE